MSTEPKPGLSAAGRKNRRDLYLIVGTMVAVVVASTLLFRAATSGVIDLPALLGTSNKGSLITPPLPLSELTLRSPDGEQFDVAAQERKWTLMVLAGDSCDDACLQNLYLTRQVRTALGRDAGRVRRYLVTTSAPDAATESFLAKEHPNLQRLVVDRAEIRRFLAPGLGGKDPVEDHLYFVVDPQGWVMMFYTPAHDGKSVLADLRFLLKNSHEQEEG